MQTDFKPRMNWQEQDTLQSQEAAVSVPLEAEFSRYNFLRNIWGTYFHDRHKGHSQDTLDQINKIVAMMKIQIRFMTEHEKDSREGKMTQSHARQVRTMHQLQKELQRTSQKMEQSQMKIQEMLQYINNQHQKMLRKDEENDILRKKIVELRQSRNRMSEQVIKISSKLYEAERNQVQEMSLSHVSAISAEDEEPEKIQIPAIRESIFELCDETRSDHSQEKPESGALGEIHLNIPITDRHALKQCYYSQQIKEQKGQTAHKNADFLKEMRRIKQQTQRIIDIENNQPSYRKSLNPKTTRPTHIQEQSTRQRRFKRIR